MIHDEIAVAGIVLLVIAIVWLGYEIRRLHADLQPVIDSTIVRELASV